MRQALIVFTRVPIPGRTKTRLQALLTPRQCAQAHSAFLRDIVQACRRPQQWELFVYYAPEGPLELLRELLPEQQSFFPQQGAQIGERMDHAITTTLKMGYERCVLVGADVPQLDSTHIDRAMRELEKHELVLLPTLDGGYCLIGSRTPCPDVFVHQSDGTASVFDSTVAAAQRAGLRWWAGEALRDVDEPQDLDALWSWLQTQPEQRCPNSRRFLDMLYHTHFKGEEL